MRNAVYALLLGAGWVSAQTSPPDTVPFPNAYYPGFEDPSTDGGAVSGQTSPPFYPSPWMDGSGGWAKAYASAQAFVKQLTLIEKVNLTTGVGWAADRCVGNVGEIPRLGFRSLCMQDSPLGVRLTDYNSVFPAGVTIAATWDRGLFYTRGRGMGSEHYGKGVDVQLGPVVGPLGRAPEGGRNWEGFSPDPVLSGQAVAQTVKGIQSAGVVACTKHLIGNEQEHFRNPGQYDQYYVSESASSNIDDKTMHELYLWPFADAIRAGTGAIMCSYNQINNSYGCGNSYILNNLVKGELGFQGFIMSDWAAQHSGVSTALAGLDMTMPGDVNFDTGTSFWGANLTVAVLNGTIPEWRIDDMATRIMAAWYYVGRSNSSPMVNFDSWTLDSYGPRVNVAGAEYQLINEHVNVQANHAAQIRTQAARGTVLLKNTNGALPLTGMEAFTAVIGNDAGDNQAGPNGCGDRSCDNGTLGIGWGSGTANYPFLVTPMTAIQGIVLNRGGGAFQGVTDNFNFGQIRAVAAQATVAIVFVNSDSGEGYIEIDGNLGDRNNMTLWQGGDAVIQAVAAVCNNTIVVIHSGGPILVQDYYDNENITGLIWAGMPGEQSGNSIADVLYGKVNPSGKLPFTMGALREDYGTDLLYAPNEGTAAPQLNFAEGVFIDYRAFDKHNITPIYEFGYGLSYTTFAYSGLSIVANGHGTYKPNSGMTMNAPVLGTVGTAGDDLFPADIPQYHPYIYPYLTSTDLETASGDPDYGQAASAYLPANAQNGTAQPVNPAGGAPGGNPGLWDVLFTVTGMIENTGSVQGREVWQLYISLGGPSDPVVVLRDFDIMNIPAGQGMTFKSQITRRDISNWDTATQNWVISDYPKTVYVGSSSRKLHLSGSLPLASAKMAVAGPSVTQTYASYATSS